MKKLNPMVCLKKFWRSKREFVVYDIQKEHSSRHSSPWLEAYVFIRKGDEYKLVYGVGWVGGFHNDGVGGDIAIPKEWFDLPWDDFISKMNELNIEYHLADLLVDVGKSDWPNLPGLKKFLGFC